MRGMEEWLESIGLSEYLPRFQENAVDLTVVRDLSDADLKEIGIPLGPRRRLMRAINEMSDHSQAAAPSPQAREGAERRQLTVLFCDMVDSTALSVQLDPEDLRTIISSYHSTITKVIFDHSGVVARYMGDGLLAYFGYPEAHEDDAEQAVHAALGIIRAVELVKPQPVQVRVGIATGTVVIGDLLVGTSSQEQSVVGETPNLAARLQVMADPGTVLICNNTQHLVGGQFEFQAIGPSIVKGWSQPIRAWQVLRSAEAESRFRAQHQTTLPPPIGREEEIDVLLRRWRCAEQGDGRVIVLTGEPGIGKSHIAISLQDRLHPAENAIWRLYCSAHHSNSVLFPIVHLIERVAGFERGDLPAAKFAKLSTFTDSLAAGPEILAVVASLASLPRSVGYSLPEIGPQKHKERTLEALIGLFERQSLKQPHLMVFEDAHWIDPTSLELLSMLVDKVPDMSTMILITVRPEFVAPWPSHSHVTVMPLTRLSRRDGMALVARVTGGKELPEAVVSEIVARTDGIPLFVEELTKTILESGLLRDTGNRFELDHPLPSLAIPTTLQASLMARLDRLAPVREVAQIGAVVGRQFSYELLLAVAGLSERELEGALEQLVTSGLIFRRGDPPQSAYTFKHALVREAAYSGLLKSRRIQLHAAIADALERDFPEIVEAQPETLAHHLSEASLFDRARSYWLAAGRKAAEQSANIEAIAHLQRGLATFLERPVTPEDIQQEFDFRLALGPCLIATQGPASKDAIDTFVRCRELCDLLGDPPEYLQVMFWLTTASVMRGELPLARQMIEALLDRARSRGDRPALLNAIRGKAMILLFTGHLTEALRVVDEALEAFNASSEAQQIAARMAGQDAAVADLSLRSWALWLLGQTHEAVTSIEAAIDRATAIGHPHSLAYASYYASVLYALRDEPNAAMAHADRCVALSAQHGFRQWHGLAHAVHGISKAACEPETSALDEVGPALEQYRSAGYQLGITALYVLLAECLMQHQENERANEVIDSGLSIAQRNFERIFESELFRLKARVVLALGGPRSNDMAGPLLQRALDIATEQGALSLRARAAADMDPPGR